MRLRLNTVLFSYTCATDGTQRKCCCERHAMSLGGKMSSAPPLVVGPDDGHEALSAVVQVGFHDSRLFVGRPS
ncbi:unnamed protein product [Clavelina lepadiformis]|uniref:Uncharacterized protein n=1 Tax=Clavelina lepadiformis TaxID=159417 RepID=A0ABP0G190_CLALP